MKTTTLGIPTTNDKEHTFNQLVVWLEASKGKDIPSWRQYDFGHAHDGITVTPKYANHLGVDEMKVINHFCENFSYGLEVFVKPGVIAPTVLINICQ